MAYLAVVGNCRPGAATASALRRPAGRSRQWGAIAKLDEERPAAVAALDHVMRQAGNGDAVGTGREGIALAQFCNSYHVTVISE